MPKLYRVAVLATAHGNPTTRRRRARVVRYIVMADSGDLAVSHVLDTHHVGQHVVSTSWAPLLGNIYPIPCDD